ncbi:MAG: extracellular solute-binding protein family 1, partial [Firmicutes bacterium]|nr:extracellular solute-binding protein family 1 [Bacillota bacterium]
MSKKIISILLAVMLIGSMLLAGCSKTDKVDTGEDKSAATNSTTESKDEGKTEATTSDTGTNEKVNITYSMWGSAEEGANVQVVADKFNASQDKIQVEVVAIPWENYMTKLNTMAAANQLPDTGMMQEQGVIAYSAEGMLSDISTMFGEGEAKPLDSLAYTYQGKVVSYASANEVLVLYYNKDMFDAAGVAYPPATLEGAWTWDEFVAAAKKLTLDSNGKHPEEEGFDTQNITQYGCMVENLTWQLEPWTLSNGGGFYNEDGTEVTIDKPESMEAIQKVADLYLVDHVAPLSAGLTDDGIPRSIITGTVAMSTNGTWNVGTCLNVAKAEGLNYGVAVLPYMKEKVTINTSGANVVFSQTKHLQEAMEWIKWYGQEENNWDSLIATGIWMPRLDKYYKDETLTHKWVDNPNFP